MGDVDVEDVALQSTGASCSVSAIDPYWPGAVQCLKLLSGIDQWFEPQKQGMHLPGIGAWLRIAFKAPSTIYSVTVAQRTDRMPLFVSQNFKIEAFDAAEQYTLLQRYSGAVTQRQTYTLPSPRAGTAGIRITITGATSGSGNMQFNAVEVTGLPDPSDSLGEAQTGAQKNYVLVSNGKDCDAGTDLRLNVFDHLVSIGRCAQGVEEMPECSSTFFYAPAKKWCKCQAAVGECSLKDSTNYNQYQYQSASSGDCGCGKDVCTSQTPDNLWNIYRIPMKEWPPPPPWIPMYPLQPTASPTDECGEQLRLTDGTCGDSCQEYEESVNGVCGPKCDQSSEWKWSAGVQCYRCDPRSDEKHYQDGKCVLACDRNRNLESDSANECVPADRPQDEFWDVESIER